MPDVETSFKFLKWLDLYRTEKPFVSFIDIPEDAQDKRDNNLHFEDRTTKVSDIRSNELKYTLDDHGFMVRWNKIDLPSYDSQNVRASYLPEVEKLLKEAVDGVDEVFFFDWRLRRNEPEKSEEVIDLNDASVWLLPVFAAHNDQSASAVLNRIRLQMPRDAERLLKGRVRVINIWRPIKHPVEDCPLAFTDGSTVNMSDLIETDHVRRHYVGSNLYAMYNPRVKWYYLSNQKPEEVIFMKMFDSARAVKASCCPHASFEMPNQHAGILPRESIEVRALVFTHVMTLQGDE